jgi:hypothetical protein
VLSGVIPRARSKTSHCATLFTSNRTSNGLGQNPGPPGERPTRSRTSHGTAFLTQHINNLDPSCHCVCVCVCVYDVSNRVRYREIPCQRCDMDCTLFMYMYLLFPKMQSTNNVKIAIPAAQSPLVVLSV